MTGQCPICKNLCPVVAQSHYDGNIQSEYDRKRRQSVRCHLDVLEPFSKNNGVGGRTADWCRPVAGVLQPVRPEKVQVGGEGNENEGEHSKQGSPAAAESGCLQWEPDGHKSVDCSEYNEPSGHVHGADRKPRDQATRQVRHVQQFELRYLQQEHAEI